MKIKLIILVALLYSLLFLIIGFLVGKFYYFQHYDEHPLIIGIKSINEANNADFACSCFSIKRRTITFTFDEKQIYNAYFWNG